MDLYERSNPGVISETMIYDFIEQNYNTRTYSDMDNPQQDNIYISPGHIILLDRYEMNFTFTPEVTSMSV